MGKLINGKNMPKLSRRIILFKICYWEYKNVPNELIYEFLNEENPFLKSSLARKIKGYNTPLGGLHYGKR